MVLLYLATSLKDAKLLVLRSSAQWKTLIGEGLWIYLKDYNRLLVSEHNRSLCLTEENIEAESHRIIAENVNHKLFVPTIQ